jgi:hypothetical protein
MEWCSTYIDTKTAFFRAPFFYVTTAVFASLLLLLLLLLLQWLNNEVSWSRGTEHLMMASKAAHSTSRLQLLCSWLSTHPWVTQQSVVTVQMVLHHPIGAVAHGQHCSHEREALPSSNLAARFCSHAAPKSWTLELLQPTSTLEQSARSTSSAAAARTPQVSGCCEGACTARGTRLW